MTAEPPRSGRRTTTHAGRILGEPKTESSRRLITLAPVSVEALRAHRIKQLKQRLVAGQEWQDNDLVFPSSVGTPMSASNLVNKSFLPLIERAVLPRIRFHDLRHTAATLLLSEGVHPKIVQERLGHSQISLTLDTYSHILPTMQEEAAPKLDRILPARGNA